MYRTFHPTAVEYTFILFKHILNIFKDRSLIVHKISLHKFKKTETISSMFSDHNDIKLEIRSHNRGKTGKYPNT